MLTETMARNILAMAKRYRDEAFRSALPFQQDTEGHQVYDGRIAVLALTKAIKNTRQNETVRALRDAFHAMVSDFDQLAIYGQYTLNWEKLDEAIETFASDNGLIINDDGTITVMSILEIADQYLDRGLDWDTIRKHMQRQFGIKRTTSGWRSWYCREKAKTPK